MGEESKGLPELFSGINSARDLENATDLQKKHTPVITAPDSVKAGECFEVVVQVGKLLAHPNGTDHFIEYIELYAGEAYLARVDLTAVRTCPVLKVCVNLDRDLGGLRALTRCNLHGVWEGISPITVS